MLKYMQAWDCSYASMSPGTVLDWLMIKHAIGLQFSVFDFGRGAEAHGSGSRCGTIAAVFGATSVSGATSRAALVLAARRGVGVSVGSTLGAAVLPELQAMSAAARNTRKSRLSLVFVTSNKGPAASCMADPSMIRWR